MREEVREIMDELNNLGGMTPAHMVLITELVAVCLSAAGPKPPMTGAERVRLCRERKKGIQCNDVTLHVTDGAVYNNIINKQKTDTTAPLVTPALQRRGSRLPDDWNPSDALWSWGKEKLSEADLRFETAAFKDYWAAQSGQRGVKLDWDKTWKTWVREAVRRRERFKPKPPNPSILLNAPKRTWAEIKAARKATP